MNKFYSKAESETGDYRDENNVYYTDTLGFYFQSYFITDKLCVRSGNLTSPENVCYMSEMYAVQSIQADYWFKESYELVNVGGILGLGFNSTGSFW